METKIYDKVQWHLETIEKASVLNYFKCLMDFLKTHNYLNSYGLEIYEVGVDTSLSVTSKMLTEKGNAVMESRYDSFLKTVNFNVMPDFSNFHE
jgi:hypothetical protein